MNVSQTIAGLEDEIRRKQTRIDWVKRVYAELPGDMPSPTMSNEGEKAHLGKPGAWLSWSTSYGDTWKGSDILNQLHAAGFKTLPATLVKWADYRRNPEVGFQADIPEKRKSDALTDSQPIAPVWVTPNQFTPPEAHGYLQSPSGLIIKATVPAPASARISARKKYSTSSDWYYERGTAKLDFPESWHAVRHGDLSVANVSAQSKAFVDTEQGISGAIYFDIFFEQDEFPMTAGEFLAALEK